MKHFNILLWIKWIVVSLGLNAAMLTFAADPFDCRPYLLSKAIWQGDNERQAVDKTLDILTWGISNVFDSRQNFIAKNQYKKAFDMVNAAYFMVGEETKDAESWGDGNPIPSDMKDIQRESFSNYLPAHTANYTELEDQIKGNVLLKLRNKLSGFSSQEIYQTVFSVVKEMNQNVCEECFCRPRKHRPMNEVTAYDVFHRFRYHSLSEMKRLVVKKATQVLLENSTQRAKNSGS